MVIRCSLLGHDYDEAGVEREREERGSEVVVTIREIQECARCGDTMVVSENKEVTSLSTAEPDPVDGTADDLDGEVIEQAEPSPEPEFDVQPEHEDPDTDDGMILDDEDETGERRYGEWPEPEEEAAADDAPAEPAAWPEVEGEDEGFDAEPATDDGAEVEFGGGGLTPETDEEHDPADEDVEFIETVESTGQLDDTPVSPDSEFPTADDYADSETGHEDAGAGDSGTGITSARAAPTPGTGLTDDAETEFVCPQCDFVQPSVSSSLRAGDICPECRRGYITEESR